MEKATLWGIVLVMVLAAIYGSAEEISPSKTTDFTTDDTELEKVANETFSDKVTEDTAEQPSKNGDEVGDVSQVADRRMSLMDFFFGNKKNNENQRVNEAQSAAIIPGQQQVQVQQNPNQLMFVRESTFPNPNGGLLSRLILARRMARLQRFSNRLQFLPSMLGLLQRQQQQDPQQQTLNQRIGQQYRGDSYNPADIMLEGIGFKNASISPHRQYSSSRFNNPNFADDSSFEQNQGFGKNSDSSFFGVNDVPNQPYPQTQSSLDEYGVQTGNFGLRQNVQSYDQQQPRQKQNIFNQQQPLHSQQQPLYNQQQPLYNQQQPLYNQQQPLYNQQQPLYGHQQQFRQQQPAYDQNSQVQQPAYDQQPQVNQQPLYDQQQQLKNQQQQFEQQELLRQQQEQLYEQQQQKLRQQQQQLYDQQQQQIKLQQELYDKKQQQLQLQNPRQEAHKQQEKQQVLDQQQLKLQQELYEQQKQLKELLLDQQEKLKTQDARFQQLQQQLQQDQKQEQQGKEKIVNQQARDSSYYGTGERDGVISGSSGILDFGGGGNLGPGAYEVGLDIGPDPFKSDGVGQNYNSGGHVNGNLGLGAGTLDKTSHEPIIHQKPVPVVPPLLKLPLFPLGILPRPLLNLNGKVFFGAELGKGAGLTTGGWK